jgi:coniferyl-aldehyde dehydrogenase
VTAADLAGLLERQRSAFVAEREAPLAVRTGRLERGLELLVSHEREFCEALAADFGQRPADITRFADLLPSVLAFRDARRHLRRWMRPLRRSPGWPLLMPGIRARIVHQALGVVGVISPWNFPVNLSFAPLAGILAAGNRCMIKPSELTPQTAALMRRLVAKYFAENEVAVVTGGRGVAEAFSQLPFDHLVFTGSTTVGRRVMAAAAANLVPVTLELGGKCPAIVGRSAALARAVDRIMLGKLVNAGQVCLAPDHVYVARETIDEFTKLAQQWVARSYPVAQQDRDCTSIISEAHAQRIEALLEDARSKGASVITLGAARAPGSAERRVLQPALVLGVTAEMRLMREEIFGPLLPLLPYDRIEEVIGEVNRRPAPLALYYFGRDTDEERTVLARTISGGVTVNDIAMHFLSEALPFGGVGASGMGAYHGEHGFRRFSHARAVLKQTPFDMAGLVGLRPPYGPRLRQSLRVLLRR